MRMRHLAAPLCLAGLISSMTGALAAPAQVMAAVNLRTGPGAQYYTIMTLPPGTPVEIYGCLNDDTWCDVGYGNTRGWMSSRYLGSVGNWSPEDQIMRPPVFSPPPIYREPPVYANPPPIYRRPPVYRQPQWDQQDAYPGDIYIEPPPVYVYRPPAGVGPAMPDLPQPNVGVYRVRPGTPRTAAPPPVVTGPPMPELPQPYGTYRAAPQTTPRVASTPPATVRPAPTAPSTTVTQPTAPAAPPVATQQTVPSVTQPPPVATQPAAPSVASGQPTTPTTETKPKYGGAVGKPGAPCKWVNGVCRND